MPNRSKNTTPIQAIFTLYAVTKNGSITIEGSFTSFSKAFNVMKRLGSTEYCHRYIVDSTLQ